MSTEMKPDIYNENCPSRRVLDIISNKWVILIIGLLAQNPLHFGELKRAIGNVSPKVLTQLLKMLGQHGIVVRTCKEGSVMKVEYSLSPVGISLSKVCEQITNWAEGNISAILTV